MKISQESIDSINDSLADVVARYTQLPQKHVNKFNVRCPFHDDKKASMSIDLAKNIWYCHSCGIGGDALTFVAKAENLELKGKEYQQAAKIAAEICHVNIKYEGEDGKDEDKNANERKGTQKNRLHQTAPSALMPPRYFDKEVDAMAQEVEQTNLYKFLCRLWDSAEVKRVMELYKVGRGHYINSPRSSFNDTDEWAMNPNPCRLQNSLATNSFPSIDTAGHCHAVKIIPYPVNDHHRIKDAQPNKAPFYWLKPEQNQGAYFGTHLLPLYPDKPLAVVESEKSAVIGTLFCPAYIWIAVQTKGKMKPCREMEALAGRQINLFPDTDGMESWTEIAQELSKQGYDIRVRDEVMGMFPPESKCDIADVIIWEMERRASNE